MKIKTGSTAAGSRFGMVPTSQREIGYVSKLGSSRRTFHAKAAIPPAAYTLNAATTLRYEGIDCLIVLMGKAEKGGATGGQLLL
jgi:hypothetical protein